MERGNRSAIAPNKIYGVVLISSIAKAQALLPAGRVIITRLILGFVDVRLTVVIAGVRITVSVSTTFPEYVLAVSRIDSPTD